MKLVMSVIIGCLIISGWSGAVNAQQETTSCAVDLSGATETIAIPSDSTPASVLAYLRASSDEFSKSQMTPEAIVEAMLKSDAWNCDCTEEEARTRAALVEAVLAMSGEAKRIAARLLQRLPYTYTEEFQFENDNKRDEEFRGKILPHPDHLRMDVQTFTSTVKLSLEAREKFPWCAQLDDDLFLRYVIVHRGTTEALEDWRGFFWNQADLHGKVDEFAATYRAAQTPDERSSIFQDLIAYLNTEYLTSKCKYKPRGMPDLTPSKLFETGIGRCTDLTNALMAICRTYGIAAAGVRTIWWPRADSNHYWAALFDPNTQEWYDVDGAGGRGTTVGRNGNEIHAKMYWLDMGAIRGTIRQTLEGDEHPWSIQHYLQGLPQLDMTWRYTPVGTIEIKSQLEEETPVYLCCWNSGDWKECAATRVANDGTIRFENVGCRDGVLYAIHYTDDRGRTRTVGRPGILTATPEGSTWKQY